MERVNQYYINNNASGFQEPTVAPRETERVVCEWAESKLGM